MKSTFFHVGVNRTKARETGLSEPHLNSDGSIPFIPLPEHHDPDFKNLTYGDPWGRLGSFEKGDIAWFIESGTTNQSDWGYYLVAYLEIEDVYRKSNGSWDRAPRGEQSGRIAQNAHEVRRDMKYDIILGEQASSRLLFSSPIRISFGQDAFEEVKKTLGLPLNKPTTGYWYKKWFQRQSTDNLFNLVSKRIRTDSGSVPKSL